MQGLETSTHDIFEFLQVYEILDNAIDEVQGGHATNVRVELDLDSGWVSISDDGRGIPTSVHPATGKSALETVLTVLHAGGKFGGQGSGYSVSGGLHGVGISVVNALSEQLHATIWYVHSPPWRHAALPMPSPCNTEPQPDSADAGLSADLGCIALSLHPESLSAIHLTSIRTSCRKGKVLPRCAHFRLCILAGARGRSLSRVMSRGSPSQSSQRRRCPESSQSRQAPRSGSCTTRRSSQKGMPFCSEHLHNGIFSHQAVRRCCQAAGPDAGLLVCMMSD